MPTKTKRERVTSICRALPGAEHIDHSDHTIYRVRGKVFAYFLDNHHGDGIVSVCVKSERGENADRARLAPERFYLPAYIGPPYGAEVATAKTRWRLRRANATLARGP